MARYQRSHSFQATVLHRSQYTPSSWPGGMDRSAPGLPQPRQAGGRSGGVGSGSSGMPALYPGFARKPAKPGDPVDFTHLIAPKQSVAEYALTMLFSVTGTPESEVLTIAGGKLSYQFKGTYGNLTAKETFACEIELKDAPLN